MCGLNSVASQPEGDKRCSAVCVCAFVVNMWFKYNISLRITHADVVERNAVMCGVWGQEEAGVCVSCEGPTATERMF